MSEQKSEQLGKTRNRVPVGAVATTAHGIRAAWYSNRGDGTQWTFIECLCGAFITGQTSLWEDAGSAMDEHLRRHETQGTKL